LGKNDHIANITDAEIIKNATKVSDVNKIDSLFIKDYFRFITDEDDFDDIDSEYVSIYKYEEMLAISLEETTNKYNLDTFVYTNSKLNSVKDTLVYDCNDKSIFFF